MIARRFDNLPERAIYDYPPLRAYLSKVHKRHKFVHLLGLPNRRDRPNIPTSSMFVRPLVSPRAISVDSDPNDWMPQCESIYAALERYRRLLLLGEPGVGKTTLLSRLAWGITFAPSRGPFIDRFGWVLPVPMVLRELSIQGVTTFDGLLDAFLSNPVGEPLRDVDYLQSRLREGRAFVLLDGIDELGSKEARRDLRAAVFDGMKRFPDCLWLLSSRIVGYGDVPFEGRPEPSWRNGVSVLAGAPAIGRRYIAPFDDSRIRAFVHKLVRLAGLGGAQGRPGSRVGVGHWPSRVVAWVGAGSRPLGSCDAGASHGIELAATAMRAVPAPRRGVSGIHRRTQGHQRKYAGSAAQGGVACPRRL